MIVMHLVFQPRNFGPPLLEGPKAPEQAGPKPGMHTASARASTKRRGGAALMLGTC